MADDTYTVKINRRDGIVEITGPDKDWIAEQLDRLAVVFEPDPGDVQEEAISNDGGESKHSQIPKPKKLPDAEGESPAKRRGRGSGSSFKRNDDLVSKLVPETRQRLDAFVNERRAHFKEATDQAAILAEFLQTELGFSGVTPSDLYTIYDVMGWRAFNPRNALENAKVRKSYFSATGNGGYRLSHTGEVFARHDAKQPPADKT
jgi:hypothetical protein